MIPRAQWNPDRVFELLERRPRDAGFREVCEEFQRALYNEPLVAKVMSHARHRDNSNEEAMMFAIMILAGDNLKLRAKLSELGYISPPT